MTVTLRCPANRRQWWYMKKYNMTKPIKCPEGFLNALALGMTLETEAVSESDTAFISIVFAVRRRCKDCQVPQ